jgi:phosphatidylinositol glycan class B
MIGYVRRAAANHTSFYWILLAGLIVQVITSITQAGVSSADQHFQIVEFSLDQLGKKNGFVQVWEYTNFVRPTVQVYLFSGYHLLLNALNITDPYTQLTILRVFLGVIMWVVFNLLALHFTRNAESRVKLIVLLLMNLSWALPYSRTLFSAEMMGSLFFFGALLLYDHYKDRRPSFLIVAVAGFLFCLAFYLRFQMAFGMVGVAVWLLFFERKYTHILPLAVGFIAGAALNTWLDYAYYDKLVITPYEYFHANIIAGRADYFGRSSFLRYIGLIILVTPAPLFSILVFLFLLRTSVTKYREVIVLSTVLFVVFHSLVGHKEERFIFPVFNAFPLMIGYAVPSIQRLFNVRQRWAGALSSLLLGTTVFLNAVFLLVFCSVPYSQTIVFSEKLSEHFRGQQVSLFCVRQTPFETPSGNQMEFYKLASQNIGVQKIKTFDADVLRQEQPQYLAVAYNEVKDHFELLNEMGYQPVFNSSDLLWNVNDFLHSRKMNTINEIWRLYEKP